MALTQAYSGAVNATKVVVDDNRCRFRVIDIGNNNAAVSFLQIFNLATAGVTVGTTTPLMTIEIPANSGKVIAPGELVDLGGSGFVIAGTTGRANSTNPSTALDVNIMF
jgi:hypothetical protein